MHPNIAGALVNSALFLSSAFVMGLVTNHPRASLLALAAMGVAFLSHILQLANAGLVIVNVAVAVSWFLALCAFVNLL